jgi:hypothetical protein
LFSKKRIENENILFYLEEELYFKSGVKIYTGFVQVSPRSNVFGEGKTLKEMVRFWLGGGNG